MFNKRDPRFGITFVGTHVPGSDLKDEVKEGDSVTLKAGTVRVLVRDIVSIRTGRFQGYIYGFEPDSIVQHGDLKLGQLIDFDISQIFGCQSV